ncbi:MAG TPA: carbohydrate binding domain-containing protein, partial [Nocardioidaceae bacterium]|nr:carbohydrate binding domain-containing protein [Nocardioidaceae bacterium]
GTVTFADPNAARTTATFSTAGTYTLRLSATDSALSAADDVTIVVTAASTTNTAPDVSAGPDQTITLPASAALNGTATDDGQPHPPATVTPPWTKLTGPGTVTFTNPAAQDTMAAFSVPGTYTLRLSATDSALNNTDDVTVTVNPQPASGNLVANPGFETDTTGWKGSSGQTLTRVPTPHTGAWAAQLSNTNTGSTTCQLNDSPDSVRTTTQTTYTGSVWVKGDAAGTGSTVRLRFREYAGQTNAGSKETSVTLSTEWQQLRLTYVPSSPGSSLDLNVVRSSSPGGAVCFLVDDISIIMGSPSTTNTAPTVSAGPDQSLTLPAAATLNGTVTDDGLPIPPGATTATWTKVSGPGTVTFANPAATDTTASFSTAGTYTLRLTADDSALTTSDDLTIVVSPVSTTNTAPTVSAGADQSITLPAAATLSGTVTDDNLPAPPAAVTATWSKLTGPGTVTFADPASVDTTASFSEPGTYTLRLTADDSALTGSDDLSVVVSPQSAAGNLVDNPGFETDTAGWKGSSGTSLTRVASPHSGGWAGQLTNTNTGSTTCQLNDSPDWVRPTTQSTYTATAWVKGDAAGIGSTVRLRFREYAGQVGVGSAQASVTLSTDWQQVQLTYVPSSPGSTLDFNIIRSSTPAGAVCFLVDDVEITSS